MTHRIAVCLLFVIGLLGAAHAAEYFVRVDGSDTNDGLTRAAAFGTIQRGVDALEPGDTLTILPGEYREGVAREGLGDMSAETVIRAAIPGTVLLRGDEPAPEFRGVDGYRFVYAAAFPRPPQAVNEINTMTRFRPALSVADLEFEPGRFHYDEDTQTLSISTSDLQPPDRHRYTVSTVEGRGGVFLREANRVTIEGLAATGFSARRELPRLPGGNHLLDRRAWGFYLSHCRYTTIRGCTAFLNQSGIGSHTGWVEGHGRGNLIEGCVSIGSGIRVYNPTRDTVRDARVWGVPDMGIATHGRGYDTSARFEGSFSWSWYGGGGAFQMKSPGDRRVAHRCVAPDKMILVPEVTHSLLSRPQRADDAHPSNIYTALEDGLDMEAEFADPANHDYRLQANSRFRGTGPNGADRGPFPYEANIFYLAPEGDDAADGLSVEAAWRTLEHAFHNLRPGDTLYLAEGAYTAETPLRVDGTQPVTVRGRGRATPVIEGALALSASAPLHFERIEFAGPVSLAEGRGARFDNCRFAGGPVALAAESASGLRVTHSEFAGFSEAALRLAESGDAFAQGNVFGNAAGPAIVADRADAFRYCDHNTYRRAESAWRVAGDTYALGGLPGGHERYAEALAQPDAPGKAGLAARAPSGQLSGNWRMDDGKEPPLRVEGPFLHSASATSANIEWWSSEPRAFEVRWGTTPETQNRVELEPINPYHPHGTHLDRFNTFSLTGLEPDTRYHAWILLEGEEVGRLAFSTRDRDPAPRTLHVAPDGDDAADGLSRETAWRTVARAADRVRPGDTVLIAGGVYHESVRPRVTGTADAPIVFRSALGEQVVLDGHDHMLNVAFNVYNKSHIAFDGFYLRNYRRIWTRGLFNIVRGSDIAVTRCFADGSLTGGGTTPELVTGGGTENLLVKNCVQVWGWGFIAYGNPRGMRVENNVVVRVSINPIAFGGDAEGVTVRNNIITDNLGVKRSVSLAPSGYYGVANVRLLANCFFLRWPEGERSVFGGGEEGALLAQHHDEHGIEEEHRNIAANPQFALFEEEGEFAESPHFQDAMIGKIEDFNDLFATNPELVERGIGLQPGAFEDFHFNRGE